MLLLLLSSFLPLACSPDTAMRDKKPLAAAKEGDILWHRFAGWNVGFFVKNYKKTTSEKRFLTFQGYFCKILVFDR